MEAEKEEKESVTNELTRDSFEHFLKSLKNKGNHPAYLSLGKRGKKRYFELCQHYEVAKNNGGKNVRRKRGS